MDPRFTPKTIFKVKWIGKSFVTNVYIFIVIKGSLNQKNKKIIFLFLDKQIYILKKLSLENLFQIALGFLIIARLILILEEYF